MSECDILSAHPRRKAIFLRFPARLFLLALCCAVLIAAGCGGSGASPGATRTPAAPAASPTPEPPDLTVFRGWAYPVAGGCLPKGDQLMPNAARTYRGGVHEGVDFYAHDNCATIEKGTPVVAAKDGVILRADHAYHDLTQEELQRANEKIAAGRPNDFDVIDLFRGRQVWIDHGRGVVTRYAHLEGIPPEIREGVTVTQGQTVGFIGDSGTPESLSSPDTELHLHWELRLGETFFGAGLPPDEVRAIYGALFESAP